MKKTILLFATLAGFAETAYAQWGFFGPADYDECILKGMQGVTSDRASRLVQRSCSEKFPRPDNGPVSSSELAKLSINDISWRNDYMTFNLYNGNEFAVGSVVVELLIYRKRGSEEVQVDQKTYSFDSPNSQACASPFSATDFSAQVQKWNPENDSYSYRIISGREC